ncbi:xylulokinase [Pelosinus sp. sgz500959]|uniref:xylulokinase n=1 Tax=Pelosinus sp. sgz500959 TaxID=3242472 RepID=UPI00366CD433
MNFLGIDLGTSSVKLLVMNEKGKVIQTVSKEYPVYYPRSGWAEQNPEDWWNATSEGIREITEKTGIKDLDIQSIGLSGQMHGLVLLDKDNKVLMPALLWCDQRTQDECDYITKELGCKLSQYTGNKALTGFTAPKVLWVKRNHPEVYEKISHVLLPKDYIRFKLTGEYASDVSDASGTLFFDVANRCWSQEMLELLGLPEDVLPTCYESFEVTGKITQEAAKLTHLGFGTPVIGGGGDQAAGAVGTGIVTAGMVSVALGTSGVVFACQDDYAVDDENRLHAFCHSNGKWHVMGVMLAAASCLKWWVEEVCQLDDNGYILLLEEAEKIAPGSEGLIFLPYLMGERTPYSDPHARGTFIGLSMVHNRAHMTRAILEGVTFGLRDSLEIIREQNLPTTVVRVSGGGANSLLWRQIIADIFGLRVEVVNSVDGPAFGAAILAAVGVGVFDSVEEACSAIIGTVWSTEPNEENIEKYNRVYPIYHQLYETLKDTFKVMSTM